MAGLIRFCGLRDPGGYEVREQPQHERPGGLVIVPKTVRDYGRGLGFNSFEEFLATREEYTAEIAEHDIYIELANAPRTPEGAVDFASRWGLLKGSYYEPWYQLSHFYELAVTMKSAMDERKGAVAAARKFTERFAVQITGIRHPKSNRAPVVGGYAGQLRAEIEWEGSTPRLYFLSNNLWQFCLLEHFHALSGDLDIQTCACGNYVRPPKRGGPHRKHCSDKCKMKAYRRRRSALRTSATS